MSLSVAQDFVPNPNHNRANQPRLFETERVVRATAHAFKLLSVASVAGTAAIGYGFTAAPLVVVGVFAGSAVVTVALFVAAVKLHRQANGHFWNDPDYRVAYANRVWQEIKDNNISTLQGIQDAYQEATANRIITDNETLRAFSPQTWQELEGFAGGEAASIFNLVTTDTQRQMVESWIEARADDSVVAMHRACPGRLWNVTDANGNSLFLEHLRTRVHAQLEEFQANQLTATQFCADNEAGDLMRGLGDSVHSELLVAWFAENPDVGAKQLEREVPNGIRGTHYETLLEQQQGLRCKADATSYLSGAMSYEDFTARNLAGSLLGKALDNTHYFEIVQKLIRDRNIRYRGQVTHREIAHQYTELQDNQLETILRDLIAAEFEPLNRDPSTEALKEFLSQCGTKWPETFVEAQTQRMKEIFLEHTDEELLSNFSDNLCSVLRITRKEITDRLNQVAETDSFVAFYERYGSIGIDYLDEKQKQMLGTKFMDEMRGQHLSYNQLSSFPFIALGLKQKDLGAIISADILVNSCEMDLTAFISKHGQQTFGLLNDDAQRKLQTNQMGSIEFTTDWRSFMEALTPCITHLGMNQVESCEIRWQKIDFADAMADRSERAYFFGLFPDTLAPANWTQWVLAGIDLTNISKIMADYPELFSTKILAWDVQEVREAIIAAVCQTAASDEVDLTWVASGVDFDRRTEDHLAGRRRQRSAAAGELASAHARIDSQYDTALAEIDKEDVAADFTGQHSRATREIERAEQLLARHQSRRGTLQKQVTSIEEKIRNSTEQIDRLSQEGRALEDRISALRSSIKSSAHKKGIATAVSEVKKSGLAITHNQSRDRKYVEGLLSDINGKLRRQQRLVEQTPSPRDARLAEFVRAVAEKERRLAELSRADEARIGTVERYTKEIALLEREIPADEASNREETKAEEARINDLKAVVIQLEGEIEDNASGFIAAGRAALANHTRNNQIAAHNDEIAALEAGLAERAAELQGKKDRLVEVTRKRERFIEQAGESQRRIETATDDLAAAQSALTDIAEAIDRNTDQAYLQLAAANKENQAKLERLEQQQSAVQVLHELLQKEFRLSNLKTRHVSLRTALSERRARLRSEKEKLWASKAELRDSEPKTEEMLSKIREAKDTRALIERNRGAHRALIGAKKSQARRGCDHDKSAAQRDYKARLITIHANFVAHLQGSDLPPGYSEATKR